MVERRWLASGRWRLHVLLVIIVGHLILLGGRYYATGTFVAGDSAWQFATLRSVYMQGSLDLADEARYFYEDRSPVSGHRRLPGLPDRDPHSGMVSTIYPVGGALIRLPAYAAADLLARAASALGLRHDRSGYHGLYQLLPAAFSALAGIGGLLFLAWVVSERWGVAAALPTLTVWLASPIVYDRPLAEAARRWNGSRRCERRPCRTLLPPDHRRPHGSSIALCRRLSRRRSGDQEAIREHACHAVGKYPPEAEPHERRRRDTPLENRPFDLLVSCDLPVAREDSVTRLLKNWPPDLLISCDFHCRRMKL